jgi:hypothetical protein
LIRRISEGILIIAAAAATAAAIGGEKCSFLVENSGRN